MNVKECVQETTVTREDLILLGGYVLNFISAMSQMGHVSPVMTTLYTEPCDEMSRLVRDMLLACEYGGDDAARERICRFVEESGWNAKIALAVVR